MRLCCRSLRTACSSKARLVLPVSREHHAARLWPLSGCSGTLPLRVTLAAHFCSDFECASRGDSRLNCALVAALCHILSTHNSQRLHSAAVVEWWGCAAFICLGARPFCGNKRGVNFTQQVKFFVLAAFVVTATTGTSISWPITFSFFQQSTIIPMLYASSSSRVRLVTLAPLNDPSGYCGGHAHAKTGDLSAR